MVQITANTAQFVAGLNQANKSIGLIERNLSGLKNALLGTFGAYQVIAAIKHAVTVLAEFDKTMTAVRVITGASGDDFNKLEKSALKLGSTTQYTAKQVAELQLEFGRLGFSTKEILQSTKATVDLATATGEGLARSAEIAGSTMRAFNLDATQMGRVTDVIAASLNRSALTLDSFADGIKYVAPVAAAAGVSIEETAAMMSVLADAGIKGTQAGTSLRRIFTMLTADGRPLAEKLDELAKRGITLADANDEVGLYAQTALLVLGRYKEKVDQLSGAYQNVTGETDTMARAMEDNLGTAITKVSTAYDALILSMQGSKGVLKSGAESISNVLRYLASEDVGGFQKYAVLATIFTPATWQYVNNYADALERINKAAKEQEQNKYYFTPDGKKALIGSDPNKEKREAEAAAARQAAELATLQRKVALMNEESEIESRLKTLRRDKLDAGPDELKLLDAEIALLERRLKVLERTAIARTTAIAKANFKGLGAKDPFAKKEDETPMTNFFKEINPMAEYVTWGEKWQNTLNNIRNNEQSLHESRVKNAEEYRGYLAEKARQMDMVGDAIVRVIQRELDFGQAAAEVGASVLEGIKQQIIANIILGKSKLFAANPLLGIGIVTAGFAVAQGVLKNISRGPNNRAGSSVNYGNTRIGSAGQTIDVNVRGMVYGRDLALVLDQNKYTNYYTKGG